MDDQLAPFQNVLELNEEEIKGLDLPSLRKARPIYERRNTEITKSLDLLRNNIKNQRQKLDGSQVQEFELRRSIAKLNEMDMKLNVRENKVIQELKDVELMSPMYLHKMSNFLQQFDSGNTVKEKSYQKEEWSQEKESLLNQKEILNAEICSNKKIISDFVQNYLA